jgi:predicted Zn-dependent protease with MMP-like domain
MEKAERDRFDAILEEVLEDLPEDVRRLLDEVPVIVEDEPSPELLRQLAAEAGEDPADWTPDSLCGLHTGIAFTEQSIEGAPQPTSDIRLFRLGIISEAGGWEEGDEDPDDAEDAVYEQIRITLLHEIGHQFGLDEDDLEELGYQ